MLMKNSLPLISGMCREILGIELKRDKTAETIELSQGQYTLSVLERFNMSDCNPVHAPGIGKELSAQPKESVPLNETMARSSIRPLRGVLFFLPYVRGTTWLSVRRKQLVTW